MAERAYFSAAFSEPANAEAVGEGIADALGFCARHGVMLMAEPALPQAPLAAVLDAAAARMLPLLAPERFGEEKFQQVYFGAQRNCPACVQAHRAVGRHSARLARQQVQDQDADPDAQSALVQPVPPALCIAHFQSFARGLRPESRMPALAQFAHRLGRCPPEEMLGLAVGSTAFMRRPGCASSTHPQHYGPASGDIAERLLACAEACAVCSEVERARRRWLASVPIAAAQGLDGWLFFPTCREHVGAVAALGDAGLAQAVVRHALDAAADTLHQQWRVLAHTAQTEAEQAAARITRWGRRPRRKKSDPPRPPPPRGVRCAGCEWQAIAELRATDALLKLLRSERHARAFQAGFGLCMKHHAHAYLLAPKGRVRLALAADQQRRLLENSLPRARLHRLCGG